MEVALISISVVIMAVRLWMLRGMWRLPFKHGEEYFFAQIVGPGFYGGAGATLLRQYRRSLFIPLVLDAPLAIWLVVTERLVLVFVEQWLAILVTIVIYNMLTVHFSVRATTMAGRQDELPTAVQLSMSPRRLRDYTNWPVEAVIWVLMLTGVVLTRAYALGGGRGESPGPDHVWEALGTPIWISYLEAGLLL